MADFIDLSERLKYQGNRCFRIDERYDWRRKAPFNSKLPALVPEGYVYVSVWIWASDVDGDGKRVKIESGSLYSISDIEETSMETYVNHFRDTLQQIQMHEVNETLTLDNVRVFNPHSLSITVTKEAAEAA